MRRTPSPAELFHTLRDGLAVGRHEGFWCSRDFSQTINV